MKVQCPICGAECSSEPKDNSSIYGHVWTHHMLGVYCWCGELRDEDHPNYEAFVAHIQERGGFEAHLSELVLLGCDNVTAAVLGRAQ